MTDIGNKTGALSGEPRELRSLNADEAGRILVEWGHKSYRVTQLLGWLYKKRAGSIDEMTHADRRTVKPGDVFVLQTPTGGGFGEA